MTAELCDCYATKAMGVNAVLEAVEQGFRAADLVWGIDGRFHAVDEIRRRPVLAAASNWLALATVAAPADPGGSAGILIDIGSTTTDLIPLDRGKVAARGRTDTERLQTGELVYAGVRRTPVCALATELPYRGVPTGLAAELFATTLDVFLTLGDVEPDPADSSTADGRPATFRPLRPDGSHGRCRRGDFLDGDAIVIARAAEQLLIDRLAQSAERACWATIGAPAVAVIAGSGEFFARRLAERMLGPEGRSSPSPMSGGARHRVRPAPTPLSTWLRTGHSMSEHESMTLIKVGGSLLDWPELPRRLRSFVDDELRHEDSGRIGSSSAAGEPRTSSARWIESTALATNPRIGWQSTPWT